MWNKTIELIVEGTGEYFCNFWNRKDLLEQGPKSINCRVKCWWNWPYQLFLEGHHRQSSQRKDWVHIVSGSHPPRASIRVRKGGDAMWRNSIQHTSFLRFPLFSYICVHIYVNLIYYYRNLNNGDFAFFFLQFLWQLYANDISNLDSSCDQISPSDITLEWQISALLAQKWSDQCNPRAFSLLRTGSF